MAKTFMLGRPELGAEVVTRLKQARSRRETERLQAVRLALGGEHTLQQIAVAVGRARSCVMKWMRITRELGLDELLGRHQGRGRAPRVGAKALKGLREGLRRGRWKRAADAAAWLRERHRVHLSDSGVRYWLKKAGES
jgi:transposase